MEKFGRKSTILFSAAPYVIGWLIITIAENFIFLLVGRILTGFGGGMTTLCVPLYIAEISSKQIRGILGASFQIGTTSGILIVYTLGLYTNWRYLAVMSASIPTIMVCSILFMPESPRYLAIQGATSSAIVSLATLRNLPQDHPNVIKEYKEIEDRVREDLILVKASCSDFKEPILYKPLILSISLMLFQQFCGINAVIFYTESIFQTSGYNGNPGVPSIIVAAVKVAATIFSTSIMDKVGRRILFMTGGILMCLSCITFGAL